MLFEHKKTPSKSHETCHSGFGALRQIPESLGDHLSDSGMPVATGVTKIGVVHKYLQISTLLLLSLAFWATLSNPSMAAPPKAPVAQAKPLYKMTPAEVDGLLKQLQKQPFQERLRLISERSKGTPYLLGPLGEGPNGVYDKGPLIDLSKVDCVTFCEQTLALALSKTYQEAFQTLQRIRYKNGKISMQTRNHYTMADWVPNNAWLMTDVTRQVGGPLALPLTRVISHQNLFKQQNFVGIQGVEPDRKVTIAYIPKAKLPQIAAKLQTGDVGVFIIDLPGIFASHTGLMIRDTKGQLVFRNATSIGPQQVTDLPFAELVSYLQSKPKMMGMSFIRPHGPR